ncbi:GNAT family acetyltransferase [bacterium]|nr:GNAT family acetyltransferase [bacterium]
MRIRTYEASDEEPLIALWRECDLVKPQNDPHKDIARKLAVDPELLLVGTLEGRIVASIMVGYEGHRGWINYLAVAREHRQNGFARMMMEEAERLLRLRGCPKINLQVRESNLDVLRFYAKLGYFVDQSICLGKRLEFD